MNTARIVQTLGLAVLLIEGAALETSHHSMARAAVALPVPSKLCPTNTPVPNFTATPTKIKDFNVGQVACRVPKNAWVSGDVIINGKVYYDNDGQTALLVVFYKGGQVRACYGNGASGQRGYANSAQARHWAIREGTAVRASAPAIDEVDPLSYPTEGPQNGGGGSVPSDCKQKFRVPPRLGPAARYTVRPS